MAIADHPAYCSIRIHDNHVVDLLLQHEAGDLSQGSGLSHENHCSYCILNADRVRRWARILFYLVHHAQSMNPGCSKLGQRSGPLGQKTLNEM
jgi:hypothetical protein